MAQLQQLARQYQRALDSNVVPEQAAAAAAAGQAFRHRATEAARPPSDSSASYYSALEPITHHNTDHARDLDRCALGPRAVGGDHSGDAGHAGRHTPRSGGRLCLDTRPAVSRRHSRQYPQGQWHGARTALTAGRSQICPPVLPCTYLSKEYMKAVNPRKRRGLVEARHG